MKDPAMIKTIETTIAPEAFVYYVGLLSNHVTPGSSPEPNFCDVIAAANGWNPLEYGEVMIVNYGDKQYKIVRTK